MVTYIDNISIRQLLMNRLGDHAYQKYDHSNFQRKCNVLWLYEDIAALLYGMNRNKIDWMAALRMVNTANQQDDIVRWFQNTLTSPEYL